MKNYAIRHPERSVAKSKDPAALPVRFITGFLDFARNDRHRDSPCRLQN
jgi:hypothetical protein